MALDAALTSRQKALSSFQELPQPLAKFRLTVEGEVLAIEPVSFSAFIHPDSPILFNEHVIHEALSGAPMLTLPEDLEANITLKCVKLFFNCLYQRRFPVTEELSQLSPGETEALSMLANYFDLEPYKHFYLTWTVYSA